MKLSNAKYNIYARKMEMSITGSIELINQSIRQPTNQPTNQPINQWINQWINRSFNQSIDHSINQSIIQSINRSFNQSIDLSLERYIHQSTKQEIIHKIKQYIKPTKRDYRSIESSSKSFELHNGIHDAWLNNNRKQILPP